jgi:hypothetical protein
LIVRVCSETAALLRTAAPDMRASATQKSSQAWSWLEVCNLVNNETKHVRLSVQGVTQDLTRKCGGFKHRNTILEIYYAGGSFHFWSFRGCCRFVTSLSDQQRTDLSRGIRNFLHHDVKLLATGGLVNPDHPLVALYVHCKRAVLSSQHTLVVLEELCAKLKKEEDNKVYYLEHLLDLFDSDPPLQAHTAGPSTPPPPPPHGCSSRETSGIGLARFVRH